jgi:hypothetical protein
LDDGATAIFRLHLTVPRGAGSGSRRAASIARSARNSLRRELKMRRIALQTELNARCNRRHSDSRVVLTAALRDERRKRN